MEGRKNGRMGLGGEGRNDGWMECSKEGWRAGMKEGQRKEVIRNVTDGKDQTMQEKVDDTDKQ